jgi:hypothetical protein
MLDQVLNPRDSLRKRLGTCDGCITKNFRALGVGGVGYGDSGTGARLQEFAGGTTRVVSERELPISSTMTGALLVIKPGGLRELNWHPNAAEWRPGRAPAKSRTEAHPPQRRT